MTDPDGAQFRNEVQHDAIVKVMYPIRREPMLVWQWADGRITVSQTEHEGMVETIDEAESQYDPEELESGTVVARVWMNDDETIARTEWSDDV